MQHRLVLLAMPKCASTALQSAFAGFADESVLTPPERKHMPYRVYAKRERKRLESLAGGPIETACLFREPISWLGSWWRYRARPTIPDPSKSTAEQNFDAFVEHYLDRHEGPSKIGRQSRFISSPEGHIGVDHLFAYERIEQLIELIHQRTGWNASLKRINLSPATDTHTACRLSKPLEARLRLELARDFEIHQNLLQQKS